jgi:hypothetical protein
LSPTQETPENCLPSSSISFSPNKLRRQLSNRLRSRSQSPESPAPSNFCRSPSPDRKPQPTPVTRYTTISTSGEPREQPSLARDTYRLQPVELKSADSKHVRQSSSNSSIDSQTPLTASSDESSDSFTKKGDTRTNPSSKSKMPIGVLPQKAAKFLPSSVKTALANHAQSESMGYFVLLPHEVVQLNDVVSPSVVVDCRIILYWKNRSTRLKRN